MYAAYCAQPVHLRRLPRSIGGKPVEVKRDWGSFERLIPAAHALIVVQPWLGRGTILGHLCTLRRRAPLTPVVLVTNRDADNARFLKSLVVEEVIWIRDLRGNLDTALRRAIGHSTRQRLSAAFGRSRSLPPRIRDALRQACLHDPPIGNVGQLARHLGCHRSTLWYHWRKTPAIPGPAGSLRLEDILDWLILLDAMAHRGRGDSWPAVGFRRGFSEKGLAQMARRLTRESLASLAARGPTALAARFVGEVVLPLTGEGDVLL